MTKQLAPAVGKVLVMVALLVIYCLRNIEPVRSPQKFLENFGETISGLSKTDLGGPRWRGCRACLDLLLSSRSKLETSKNPGKYPKIAAILLRGLVWRVGG